MIGEGYELRFYPREGKCEEIYLFRKADDAWNAFRLFAEPDSKEIYTTIALVKLDPSNSNDCILATMEF